MIRIGENIHRNSSPNNFIPKRERYFPATEVSDVARNMSVPSIRRIPHAMIFWSSTVRNGWMVLDFFLAMTWL
jgi:hypothetical protein